MAPRFTPIPPGARAPHPRDTLREAPRPGIEERVVTLLHAFPYQPIYRVAEGLAIEIGDAIVTVQVLALHGFVTADSERTRWRSTGIWDPDVQLTADGVTPTWPEQRGPLR